jgi:hypothetical protein
VRLLLTFISNKDVEAWFVIKIHEPELTRRLFKLSEVLSISRAPPKRPRSDRVETPAEGQGVAAPAWPPLSMLTDEVDD